MEISTAQFPASSCTAFLKILLNALSSVHDVIIPFHSLPSWLIDCQSLMTLSVMALWVIIQQHPAAGSQSRYQCFSAPVVSTMASSLGISATDFISRLATKSVKSILFSLYSKMFTMPFIS
jgi:hypothetical protein